MQRRDGSAHDEAVRQWERALELLEQVSPDDDGARLRMLLGLGEAHNIVSLDVEAQRVFGEAIDIARRIDDPVGFAWAALGFCSDRVGFVSPPMHRRLLEEALERVPSDELLVRGRLLSRLAIDRYWSGTVDETLELAHAGARGLDRCRRHGGSARRAVRASPSAVGHRAVPSGYSQCASSTTTKRWPPATATTNCSPFGG